MNFTAVAILIAFRLMLRGQVAGRVGEPVGEVVADGRKESGRFGNDTILHMFEGILQGLNRTNNYIEFLKRKNERLSKTTRRQKKELKYCRAWR